MERSVYQIAEEDFATSIKIGIINSEFIEILGLPKPIDYISALMSGCKIRTISEKEFAKNFYREEIVDILIKEKKKVNKNIKKEEKSLEANASLRSLPKGLKIRKEAEIEASEWTLEFLLTKYYVVETKLILYGKIEYGQLLLSWPLPTEKAKELQKEISDCKRKFAKLQEDWHFFLNERGKTMQFMSEWRIGLKNEFKYYS